MISGWEWERGSREEGTTVRRGGEIGVATVASSNDNWVGIWV